VVGLIGSRTDERVLLLGSAVVFTSSPMHVFGGLSWGVQLKWRKASGDSTAWKLELHVEVKTVQGGDLLGGCGVGAHFHLVVGEECLGRKKRSWPIGVKYSPYGNLLSGGLRSWPAASLPECIQGGKLRGCLTVQEVL
jgi:hypothetical protein